MTLLYWSAPAWDGGSAQVEQLLKKLTKAKEDTNKVVLLGQLAHAYDRIEPDTGIKYSSAQLVLATKLQWVRGIAYANSSLAASYYVKNDLRLSAEYYNKAIEIWQEEGDKKMLADNYAGAGDVYFFQGDLASALDYLLKAGDLYNEAGNKENAAKTLVRIGDIYGTQKDRVRAMQYLRKGEDLYAALGDSAAIGRVNASMGNVHLGQHDHAEALKHYRKALAIFERMGKTYDIAYVCGNAGSAYMGIKEYSLALIHYFRSLRMNVALGNQHGEEAAMGNIGSAYLAIAKDPRAVPRDSLIPQGNALLLKKAAEYLHNSIDLCQETGNTGALVEFYPRLSEVYAMQGLCKPALEYQLKYTAIRDSLFDSENKVKLFNVQAQYEIALKDKEIDLDKLAVEKKQNERIFYIAGIAGLLIIIAFIGRERKRSDKLLLNILPETVASELKTKGTTEVTYFDDVTVIFTDFVGFTRAGEHMTPRELINELHACFEAFDAIMGKYNIEKIKTIGDAYLAVGGVPRRDAQHAQNVVRAALEICTFMQARKEQLGDRTFSVRIGVNSGSVVAGIVGVKKFAYDIWGDTVNTAARMEQNSEADHVNISESTYELIKDRFECTYRGQMLVKNKGAMKMYYVVAEKGATA
ncbi:hypothetical protein GCM10023093_24830 [Nemorincola caseinilytica]|uniref:Guanylate cyclase domain-containing protein n=1 Tax=Nemorincola caseinilytica TaxID=2054315 RepID=A0ABP8NMI2_9BACT